jgi:hypothetical protein
VSDASRSAQDEIQENMQMVQEAISKELVELRHAWRQFLIDVGQSHHFRN